MRIRSIKPEFFEDEDLAQLQPFARLLFIGTWLIADKNGVFENRPRLIQARIFPYETGASSDVARLLPQLVQSGFLVPFEADGKEWLWIPTFKKHQRITGTEAKNDSRYPLPPSEMPERQHHGNTEETLGMNGARSVELGARSVERGKDTPSEADGFREFWQTYPKKTHKAEAMKAWRKLHPPLERVLEVIALWKPSRDWTEDGGKYIPNPASWLNGRRWEDDHAPTRGTASGNARGYEFERDADLSRFSG